MRLEPFTLIGATTRTGLLTSPLRSRFGITHRLEFYTPADLEEIVRRSAKILDVPIDEPAAAELARRARGPPRLAEPPPRRGAGQPPGPPRGTHPPPGPPARAEALA